MLFAADNPSRIAVCVTAFVLMLVHNLDAEASDRTGNPYMSYAPPPYTHWSRTHPRLIICYIACWPVNSVADRSHSLHPSNISWSALNLTL